MKYVLTILALFCALSAVVLGSAACAPRETHTAVLSNPPASRTPAASPRMPAAATSNTYAAFGVDLYLELAREKPGANIFISPASVAFALGMTLNGAASETRDAMAQTLHRPAGDQTAADAADAAVITGLNDTLGGVDLSIANALFARSGVKFKEPFLEVNKKFYGAELTTLDFQDPGTPAVINGWVAEKTREKITKIVDQIDPSSVLFLVNAIYFKGSWTKEFDIKDTSDGPFHCAGGVEIARPMMRQSGKYAYLEDRSLQAIRLPYGDGRIGMYVFLPATGSSLERFQKELTGEKLDGWISRLSERQGTIELPRFRLEYEARLKQALGTLGMGVAFDARADFTPMIQRPGSNAYIHDVLHKTFVEVNEEGTEAAAVTSVEIRLTSAMEPPRPFTMIVDRPFFFVIRDSQTGLMLFMGSIVNPK